MRKFLRKAWRALRKNIGYKLLALFFAAVLWSYVLVATNPLRDKTVNDVSVTVMGMETLKNRGFALLEGEDAFAEAVRVSVRDRNEALRYITSGTTTVIADLSNITQEGVQEIPLQATTISGSVRRVNPDAIRVTIEKRATKDVPVYAEVEKSPENLWQGDIVLKPSTIEISGAASQIERVDHVLVRMPNEHATTGVDAALAFNYEDAAGIRVASTSITPSSPTIRTTLRVYAKQEVRVEAPLQEGTQPAYGFEVTGITVAPQSVEVAATSEVLQALTHLNTQPVDVSGASEDIQITVPLAVPEDVAWCAAEQVQVTVHIDEVQQERTINYVRVHPEGSNAENVSRARIASVSVTVKGPRRAVLGLTANNLQLYVDVSGMSPGSSATLPLAWRWNPERTPEQADAMQVTIPQSVEVTIR
nr:CdaR family protein [Maliibacterium massiliense]